MSWTRMEKRNYEMIISANIRHAIEIEYKQWKDKLWAGKTKEERQKLGQFATPPPLTIKMLEKFDSLDGNVLDPCLGAGNLIAAAVIAGADPSKCYGIELDPVVHKVAQLRLSKLGVPPCNIVQGDALDPKSYEEKLQPFASAAYAIVHKEDSGNISIAVCNNKKLKNLDLPRAKANNVLTALKRKNVKLFKI